jgi:hypothetical protein
MASEPRSAQAEHLGHKSLRGHHHRHPVSQAIQGRRREHLADGALGLFGSDIDAQAGESGPEPGPGSSGRLDTLPAIFASAFARLDVQGLYQHRGLPVLLDAQGDTDLAVLPAEVRQAVGQLTVIRGRPTPLRRRSLITVPVVSRVSGDGGWAARRIGRAGSAASSSIEAPKGLGAESFSAGAGLAACQAASGRGRNRSSAVFGYRPLQRSLSLWRWRGYGPRCGSVGWGACRRLAIPGCRKRASRIGVSRRRANTWGAAHFTFRQQDRGRSGRLRTVGERYRLSVAGTRLGAPVAGRQFWFCWFCLSCSFNHLSAVPCGGRMLGIILPSRSPCRDRVVRSGQVSAGRSAIAPMRRFQHVGAQWTAGPGISGRLPGFPGSDRGLAAACGAGAAGREPPTLRITAFQHPVEDSALGRYLCRDVPGGNVHRKGRADS